MKEPIVAIDVHNILYRAWFAMNHGLYKSPAMYGLFRDMAVFARNTNSTNFVFCFDSPTCVRKSFLPCYKATRKDSPDRQEVRRQSADLKNIILPRLGYINILEVNGAEADDLLGMICQQEERREIRLVSTDCDLYQLLAGTRVSIYNPASRFTITEEWLLEQHNLTPEEWMQVKSITGCSVDNVPGIPNVGMVRARDYIQGRATRSVVEKIEEGAEVVKRNEKLVALPTPLLGKVSNLKVVHQPPIGEAVWCKVMEDCGLHTLAEKCP